MISNTMGYSPIPAAGTIIEIFEDGYEHWAIVSDKLQARQPMLISHSKRNNGVREEAWSTVVGSRRYRIKKPLTNLAASEVLTNARSLVSENSAYDVLKWNCQHFVHWCFGLHPSSPNVKQYATAFVAPAAIALIAEKSPKEAVLIGGTFVGLLFALKLLANR